MAHSCLLAGTWTAFTGEQGRRTREARQHQILPNEDISDGSVSSSEAPVSLDRLTAVKHPISPTVVNMQATQFVQTQLTRERGG